MQIKISGPARPEEIEDVYPLSPMQQGMLFHSLYAPGSGVDIQQIVGNLPEALDAPAFEQAWQQVIARHPPLRTSFHWQDMDQPRQYVHKHLTCPLHFHNWQHLSPTEQEAHLDRFLRADRGRGFNLNQPPLMRLTLFCCGPAAYRFVWTFHHILLDGRSFPLVIKELFAFYKAIRRGQNLRLEPPRPYRHYIDWLGRQDFSTAKAFWRGLLQGVTGPTPLPGAGTGPEAGYGVQQITLPNALTNSLQLLANRQQITFNTLVQGTWALLLGGYSGLDDVVFGVVRACRYSALNGKDTASMVGMFMNTVPVRVKMPPHMQVSTWLKALRAQSIAVRPYENTPLVNIQSWSDVPSGAPLFENILVFEKYRLNTLLQAQGGEWAGREFRVLAQTNYPLTLVCRGHQTRLLRLVYNRSRFNDDAIGRMLAQLQTILQGFVDTQARGHLADVPLLPAAERRQLLVNWNRTGAAYPRDACFHTLFEAQVKQTPNAIAVVYQNQRLTYRQLNEQANHLAHRLRALGVGPEVLAGICIERSPRMVAALLAVLKAGGAYVPLDPADPLPRLSFIIHDAQPAVLLTQSRVLDQTGLRRELDGQAIPIICLDDETTPAARPENPATGVTAANLAYVIYTSGSTGRPKGVMITHRGLVNYLTWCTAAYNVARGQGAPVHTSISFDLTITALFAPLLAGKAVLLLPEAGAAETTPETFRLKTGLPGNGRFSLVKLTPSHLELLRHTLSPKEAARANSLIIGGEALHGSLLEFWQTHAPHTRLVNEYGPTETVVGCCVYTVPPESPVSAAVPIGRPIANTQIYLLDRHLRPVPVGAPGQIYIGGDGLARGYLNRPGLTAERFIPHPFSNKPGARLYQTGDIGRYRPDGTLEFLGRADHQVKIRGFRVELGEIEAVLAQHPAVRDAAVLAREEPAGHKRLVAYVTLNQNTAAQDLRDFLKARLPAYMLPAAFVVLPAMPLTAGGKVNRHALPPPDSTGPETGNHAPPRTPTEEALARLWAGVLGVNRIGRHDNFFHLGGHSLLATQLVARINHTFRLDLPLRDLFDAPTVAALAGRIDTIRWAAQHPPAKPDPTREEGEL